ACNLRCRMCPQPPESDNEVYHKDNLRTLELLTVKELHLIGITGGEPFLFPDRVIEYFKIINRKFPTAEVEILTNATLLEKFEVAKKVALEAPLKTTFCVSLHADTARCYEYINQRTGSFEKTIRGIESLAKLHQSIEIRPVITAANAAFLEDIARFIYRNFPYVTHVAFMGQEIVGDAVLNLKDIWVEPIHYVSNLCRATTLLSDSGLFVSIYNLPLCLLPESHHKFAARSISDWKQEYSETCSICKKKDQCCGFFTTSESHIPMGIHAL
ncbi:MAG: radical SAM protein, partial [Kiritimatiellia bacterium]